MGISPMIWRRVLVPMSTTLRELHGIFQVAMGWEGIHLYLFDVHAVNYGSFELFAENPDVPLQQFDFRKNDKVTYVYDMGDHWQHEVRIEGFHSPNIRKLYPTCISEAGACLPEDCGGTQGFLEHLEEAGSYDA